MSRRASHPLFSLRAAVVTLATACSACGALATTPDWAGGGLAVTGPVQLADREAAEAAERERMLNEPDKVGARHVLVQHVDSRRRSENVTRTRAEARSRAQEALEKLRAGAAFATIVTEYTDEPDGAERDGDIGMFPRGVMHENFTDATFALKVGQISEVVETPFGFHIIQRTQ